jgi:hypothetical protein
MKNKSLKLRSSYFFRQRKRIYGKDLSENMPELVKPESERTESVIEDILRWADDGGQILQPNSQGKRGYSSGTGKGMMNEGS